MQPERLLPPMGQAAPGRALKAVGYLVLALVLAGVAALSLDRGNVVSPSWLGSTAIVVLFPTALVGCLALFLRAPAPQPPRKKPGLLSAAMLAGMLAWLAVVVSSTLADKLNRTPHAEDALLEHYQYGSGHKGSCKREAVLRRADGKTIDVCLDRLSVGRGILPGTPVRLAGRQGVLGFAIDAVHRR